MLVPRTLFVIITCVLALLLVVVVLRRPAPQSRVRWRSQVIATLAVGDGPDAVASYTGLDGETYGPLAFAVHGNQLCVLDTYRSQVWIRRQAARGRASWKHIVIPDSLLEAVAWDPRTRSWLVADNGRLTVFSVARGRARPLIRLGGEKGTTSAIEQMAVGPGGQIFLSWIAAGHGTVQAVLGQYRSDGRRLREHAVLLNQTAFGRTASASNVVLLSLSGVSAAPDGTLDVLGPGPSVLVVNPATLQVTARISLPRSARRGTLIGLTRDRHIYIVEQAFRRPAFVAAYNAEGRLLSRVALVHQALSTNVYADVSPSGRLYLLKTTADRYRIVAITNP